MSTTRLRRAVRDRATSRSPDVYLRKSRINWFAFPISELESRRYRASEVRNERPLGSPLRCSQVSQAIVPVLQAKTHSRSICLAHARFRSLSSVGFSLRPNFKHTAIDLLASSAISFFSYRRRLAGAFDFVHPRPTARRVSPAARIVRSISASLCAAETNSASNCDGAINTPRSSISRKNAAYMAVSDFFAPP
jgi:hypothetical protein